MKLGPVIFVLTLITTSSYINCIELFHYPIGEVIKAKTTCALDPTITPECIPLCALEESKILTPEQDAFDPNQIGYYYKKYADQCFPRKAKPNCAEGKQIVDCLQNGTTQAQTDIMIDCLKEFSVEELKSKEMTFEVLVADENLACVGACFADKVHAFNDDDTIDLRCINPRINFDFNARQVAKDCEEKNQVGSKCLRRTLIYLCLVRSFENAQQEHFVNSLKH